MISLFSSRGHRFARRFPAAAAGALVAVLAGCGSSGVPGMDHGGGSPMPGMSDRSTMPSLGSGMPGMDHGTPAGDGLSASVAGYGLAAPATTPAGATSVAFTITAAGKPLTSFNVDQTKLMHFYLIRSDLSGFQHVHPTMAADGTWAAPLAALKPGSYRLYTSFIAADATPTALVLGAPLVVAGASTAVALPPAAAWAAVDGYTVAVGGHLMAAQTGALTVTVSKAGAPVTDLQPYLDTYAHLTAFHSPDLAFAHLHPRGGVAGDHGGPALTFEALLPAAGNWRLFVQFKTGGTVHTAAVTVPVM